MCARCCSKPITRIIKIDGIETGIIGLKEILAQTYSSHFFKEEEIKNFLLQKAREYGNYVSSNREDAYKNALYVEYINFVNEIEKLKKDNEGDDKNQNMKWKIFKK